jgi:hypothetical protein
VALGGAGTVTVCGGTMYTVEGGGGAMTVTGEGAAGAEVTGAAGDPGTVVGCAHAEGPRTVMPVNVMAATRLFMCVFPSAMAGAFDMNPRTRQFTTIRRVRLPFRSRRQDWPRYDGRNDMGRSTYPRSDSNGPDPVAIGPDPGDRPPDRLPGIYSRGWCAGAGQGKLCR